MRFLSQKKKLNWSAWLNLKSWRPYFIIFIIGFALYGQALFFDFTQFDDNNLIIKNTQVLASFKNVGQLFLNDVFFSDFRIYYRPILNLSLMVDYQFGAEFPFIYHLSNLLWHLVAVSLVFYFLTILTHKKKLAFGLAIFFLIQPALSQVVVWIPGRNDSLLTVFVLAAFIFFLKFLNKPQIVNFSLFILFYLFALFTKETAAVLPVLFVLYYFLISKGQAKIKDLGLIIGSSGAVIFIWSLFRSLALDKKIVDFVASTSEIISKAPAFLLYIGKTLLPYNPAPFPNLEDSTLLFGFLTIAIVTTLILVSKKRKTNYLVFGLSWFLLFMLPFFILSSPSDFFINFLEHRLYLPLVGFLIIISQIDYSKFYNLNRKIFISIFFLFFFSLSITTLLHSRNFKNSLSLWQAAVKTTPSSAEAQKNLGLEYFDIGSYKKAEEHYLIALELNKEEIKVNNNLGVLYLNQGRFLEAESAFNRELEIYQAKYNNILPGQGIVNIFKTAQINLDYLNYLKEKGVY